MLLRLRSLLLALPLFACGARTDVEDFLTSSGSPVANGGSPAPTGGFGAGAGGGAVGGAGAESSFTGGSGNGGRSTGGLTFDDSLSVNTLTYTLESIASDNTRIIGLVMEPNYRLRADIYTLPEQTKFEMISLSTVPEPISPILFRQAPSGDRFYVAFTGFIGDGVAHATSLDKSLTWQWATSTGASAHQGRVVAATVLPSGELVALGWTEPGSSQAKLFEWALDGGSSVAFDIADRVTDVPDDSRMGVDDEGTVHILANGPLSLARRTVLGKWLPPTSYSPDLLNCYQCSHLAVSPSGSGYIVALSTGGYSSVFRYDSYGNVANVTALTTSETVLQALPHGENVVVISRGTTLPGDPFTVREWTPDGALVRQVGIGAASSVTLKTAVIAPNGRIDLLMRDDLGNFGSPSDLIVSTPAY